MPKVLAILLLATLSSHAPAAVPTTVCKIATSPALYAGKEITLSTTFITDLLESSSLIDSRCPGVVIAPYDTDGEKHPSVRAFDVAVSGKLTDHRSRVFSVVAVGRFDLDRSERVGRFTIRRIVSFKRKSVKHK
jgi:hypothetical protein